MLLNKPNGEKIYKELQQQPILSLSVRKLSISAVLYGGGVVVWWC